MLNHEGTRGEEKLTVIQEGTKTKLLSDKDETFFVVTNTQGKVQHIGIQEFSAQIAYWQCEFRCEGVLL